MNLKKVLYLLFTIALLLSLWASPASAGAQPSASALTATAASPLARPVQQGLDVGYAPQALSRTLALGTVITDVAGLSLTNDGGAELEWELYEYPEETIPVGGVPLDTGHLTDAFGYTYHDSNEPAGPRFEWIDASDGTGLGLSDDAEANVNLPFAFHFYGSPSTALRVGNNGGLLFGTTSGELAYANTSLDAAGVDDLLVPFWDDLDDETGNVYYKTVGTAPYRRFVVEWYDRPHYNYGGGVGDATIEMILYETTNNIKFQYQDVVFGNADWDGGASATVGIRSDAANYLQYSYNQAILDAGLAICFQYPGSPPCDGGRFVSWVQQTPVSGTLPAAGTQPVDVGWHADAPEVDSPGVYRATLQISSNDPVDPVIDIPMVMTVTAPANWTQLKGIVSSDRPGGPLVGAHVEIVSNTTQITVCDVSTEEDGGYECWLPWGLYDVSVSAAGYLPNEQSVNATGATYQHDVELQLDAPSVGVSPLSISDVQYGGEVTTHLLTISNGGPGDLNFELREVPGSSPEGTGAIDAGPPDIISTRRVEGDFRVDAEVSTELETGGRADFFIWLRERADLSPAYDIADADTRHEFVFEALTRTADTTQAEIRAYLEGRGLEYEVFWINNSILVRGGDLAVVEAMRARGDVYRIRGVYTRMSIPDPEQLAIVTPTGGQTEADTLWNIDIVSAPQVWSQLGITGDGAVVANIDTGVRYTHEALVDSYRGNLGGGAYDHNYNWGSIYGNGPTACTGAATAPCDWNGHGTHTMGTMVGGDGDGAFDHDVGMAPDAQWMACMGCDSPPNGCSDAALTGCAQWMVAPLDLDGLNPDPAKAPDVVNNSWGGGGEDDWYYSYVEAWNAANIIPVFSAGNEGWSCDTLGSPGSYDNVIGVGGTDSQDRNYTYTSRGPGSGTGVFPVQKPDVAAPGESVTSSTNGGNATYAAYSGTSMASPHVSGLVALMRQVDEDISREEIWDILTTTADTALTLKNGTWCGAGPAFPNYVFGYGRINALAALEETLLRSDVPWVGESPVAGTVPAGGSLDVTVTFTAPLDAPGVYTAILRVASDDPIDPAVDVPLTMTVLDTPPDLTLTKSASPTPVEAGSLLTYDLLVHNAGGLATGLTVSDALPADTVFAWADQGGTQVGDEVRWSGLSLPGGGEISLSFAVTVTCVPSGTQILNSDYGALADGMSASVAGAPLAVVAQQHDVLASFGFPQPVVLNYPLTFANTSQHATAFQWNLGDGTTSTAANPTHTYTDLGAHTVTLTATSACQTDVHSEELVVHDYALALVPPSAAGSAEPGQTVTYTLRLTNTGTLADSYYLALGSHDWPAALSTGTIGPLAAGAEGAFEVYVTVPEGAMAGDGDTVLVHATSTGDPRTPRAHDAAALATTAEAVYGLALTPLQAEAAGLPGTALTYTLHLVNAGNTADEFDVAPAGNLWTVEMPLTHAALAAGTGVDVPVRVTVPADAADGEQDVVVVTATSSGDPAAQAASTLTTTAGVAYGLLVEPAAAARDGTPGQVLTYTLAVTNTGNVADSVDLGLAGNTWPVQLPPGPLALAAGAGTELPVTVTIPAGAADGEQDVVIVTATSQGDPGMQAHATLTTTAWVACVPLSGPALAISPPAPREGQMVTLTGTVEAGSLPATCAWDFGSGQIAGGMVMTHTFTTTGTYTVTLVMSNACSSGVTVQATVTVAPTYRQYLPLLFRRE